MAVRCPAIRCRQEIQPCFTSQSIAFGRYHLQCPYCDALLGICDACGAPLTVTSQKCTACSLPSITDSSVRRALRLPPVFEFVRDDVVWLQLSYFGNSYLAQLAIVIKDLCASIRTVTTPSSQDAQRPSLDSSSNNTHVSNSQTSPHRTTSSRAKLLKLEAELIDARSQLFQASEGSVPSQSLLYLTLAAPSRHIRTSFCNLLRTNGADDLANLVEDVLKEMLQMDKLRGESAAAKQVAHALRTTTSSPSLMENMFLARAACLNSVCQETTQRATQLLELLAQHMSSIAADSRRILIAKEGLNSSLPFRGDFTFVTSRDDQQPDSQPISSQIARTNVADSLADHADQYRLSLVVYAYVTKLCERE
eukprot:TRINITY_DN11376_c0_g1_i1.p2 TRINITY_DN11376_c0_g1~~TRINITY_DN11376_c0_g1_i1.p2  ORF type:complete len:365 (+),score=27.28 TRINITY_DN11376_c0_g1_i1:2916-4010(+)